LQFKANKYVKVQTFYGLDDFCVNNMMGDATYMKDYLSYDIMNFIGVETPLTNYAFVTVNGEGYGFGIGGFQSGNASSVVNFPIDTPVSGVNMEERPSCWKWKGTGRDITDICGRSWRAISRAASMKILSAIWTRR
jgi:hypothetical protein